MEDSTCDMEYYVMHFVYWELLKAKMISCVLSRVTVSSFELCLMG